MAEVEAVGALPFHSVVSTLTEVVEDLSFPAQNSRRTTSRDRAFTPSLVNQSQHPLESSRAQSLKIYFINVRSVFFTKPYLCSNNIKIIIEELLVQQIALEEEEKQLPLMNGGR